MSSVFSSERTHPPLQVLGLRVPGRDSRDADRSPTMTPRAGASARILVVEDDPGIRDSVQMALEDEGFRVTCAEDGQQAFELLRSGLAPDIIVLDLRLPVMDGWEFRAAQKKDPALAAIPIVAVSADDSAQAAAIDAQVYLRKPLSTDVLLDSILRVLGEAERKHLSQRLEEAERFAALGRLAATVGHEVNNPLAYLMINVDLVETDLDGMADGPGEGPVLAERDHLRRLTDLLGECRVGLERIRDVVRNLQSLSRPPQPTRGPLSTNDVLDQAIAMSRYKVEHRATVVRDFGELPAVVGDPSALGQVFLNLLLNAADALPEGHARENQITIRSWTDGSEVLVEISDTGAGIPRDALPHLFEPFFTTKAMGHGTGLGLSISQRIVLDHRGRIEAFNNPERGATFRVALPTAPTGAPRRAPERLPAAPASARGRVLVIDDEPITGRTIEAALAGEHDVVPVSLAHEALARLAAGERFDVVLCDLQMPEMTGREFYEQILSDWPHAARNVVFMTGGAISPEIRDFMHRISGQVFFKPFRIDELREMVRAQLESEARRPS
jgi:signal transduction histidine kinase